MHNTTLWTHRRTVNCRTVCKCRLSEQGQTTRFQAAKSHRKTNSICLTGKPTFRSGIPSPPFWKKKVVLKITDPREANFSVRDFHFSRKMPGMHFNTICCFQNKCDFLNQRKWNVWQKSRLPVWASLFAFFDRKKTKCLTEKSASWSRIIKHFYKSRDEEMLDQKVDICVLAQQIYYKTVMFGQKFGCFKLCSNSYTVDQFWWTNLFLNSFFLSSVLKKPICSETSC